MNVLVVAAHPDDEILGLGGTLLRHISDGDRVFVYLLTDGHTSRYRDPQKAAILSPEVIARVESAKKSAALVGYSVEFGPFQDQRLDAVPAVELVQAIEAYAYFVKPDVVYIHHKGDVNIDHQVCAKVCMTAFRSVGATYPHRLLSFETVSSTEWGGTGADSMFIPNVFVDITQFLEKKIQALELYDQEMRPFPHPRSYQGLRISAQRWGTCISMPAAEAFMLLREVRR